MKIFIDTNILFSSFISPTGTTAKAFVKAVSDDNHVIISKQNVEELRVTIARKYPTKMIMSPADFLKYEMHPNDDPPYVAEP